MSRQHDLLPAVKGRRWLWQFLVMEAVVVSVEDEIDSWRKLVSRLDSDAARGGRWKMSERSRVAPLGRGL